MQNKKAIKSRHAERAGGAPRTSASSTYAVSPQQRPQQALKTLKQVQGDFINNAGFTLIELLVVVLIIGILAAVALPQYNKAVHKTRIATFVAYVQQIVRAEQVYQLENGEYTGELDTLDIDVTKICKTKGGACSSNELYDCPYNFGVDLGAGASGGKCSLLSDIITLKYCPDSSSPCRSGNGTYKLEAKYSIKTGELVSCRGELCPIVQSMP